MKEYVLYSGLFLFVKFSYVNLSYYAVAFQLTYSYIDIPDVQ